MAARVTRFSRLVITVPRRIAEPYGAALVELGAGAVEEMSAAAGHDDTAAAAAGHDDVAAVAAGHDEDAAGHDEDATGHDEDALAGATASAELRLSLPEGEAPDAWEAAARALYDAFAESLALPSGGFSVRSESVAFDYHAAWLEHLSARALTDRLWIAPVHRRAEVPTDADCLVYEAHPCFGDGSHPTTRLAACAVESFCASHPDCSVLDVGTGTGVLSLAAASTGARCLGIDVDPEAVAAARENAELNDLAKLVHFDTAPLETIDGVFDLVVANVEPRTQVELREHLIPRVAEGGQLVLTGYLVEQTDLVAEPLLAAGWRQTHEAVSEGYVLQTFARIDAKEPV